METTLVQGRVKEKVVREVSGDVEREKRERWARRMSVTSISPRPRSGFLVEKKGVNSFFEASGDMPLPLSVTDRR